MSGFRLIEGDAYERRCAEVFMTEKHYLVFHCSLCDEKYVTFDDLLEHITDQHYGGVTRQMPNDLVEALDGCGQSPIHDDDDDADDDQELDDADILVEDGRSDIATPTDEQLDEIIEEAEEDACEGVGSISEALSGASSPCNRILSGIEDTNSLSCKSVSVTEEYECTAKLRSYPRMRKNGSDSAERKYKCHICGFAFRDKCNLRSHVRRHTGRKDYVCAQCSKQFYTLTELETHGRHHTGERPYKCEKCGAGFITSSALGGHMKRHNNDRPHKCEFCEKRFFDSGLLKRHLVVHTKERNFQCQVCGASFSRKITLTAHMKIHINEREYRCSICEAAFNQYPALYSHIRSKHKIRPNPKLTQLSQRCNGNEGK